MLDEDPLYSGNTGYMKRNRCWMIVEDPAFCGEADPVELPKGNSIQQGRFRRTNLGVYDWILDAQRNRSLFFIQNSRWRRDIRQGSIIPAQGGIFDKYLFRRNQYPESSIMLLWAKNMSLKAK